MNFIRFTTSILLFLICKAALEAQQTNHNSLSSSQSETRVTILGYHDFSKTAKATEMRLPTKTLKEQLLTIKKQKLNIVNLEEFMQWKRGRLNLPDKSILITIDDGWKSVYTDAYPIFKELNIPFTLFLYSNYVDGGGRALTIKMIQEMLSSGLCSIGCHSVSHPFPAKIKKEKSKGVNYYKQFLDKEFGESKAFLEEIFKVEINTYAYPGGYYTKEMFSVAENFKYDFLFTVVPKKVTRNTPNHLIDRYIVLGTHNSSFKNAINFSTPQPKTQKISQPKTIFPVFPTPASTISQRQPTISINLSQVSKLDESSLELTVSGFGKVPHHYDPKSKLCSWKTSKKLRAEQVFVTFKWKALHEEKLEKPIKWSFFLNKDKSYKK